MLPHLDFRLYGYQKKSHQSANLFFFFFFDTFKVLKENLLLGALKEMFDIREIQLSDKPTFPVRVYEQMI